MGVCTIIKMYHLLPHSMGYVYAQGMVDELKKHLAKGVTFGRFYILAPENACSGTLNKADFETVWQYGSDETDLTEPIWFKDGVAPQCPVGGLSKDDRAFIPIDGIVKRGFLQSHSVSNYTWIFNLPNNSKGNVPSR